MNQQHRQKLFEQFPQIVKGLVYLEAGKTQFSYDTDRELDFKQESNFLYLTGIEEPDFALLLDGRDRSYTLVVPRRDASYATWHGEVFPKEYWQVEYGADYAIYSDELEAELTRRKPETVFCYNEAQAETIRKAHQNTSVEGLRDALVECRLRKSPEELDLLRHASEIASEAHMSVLAAVESGVNEAELRALFLYHCMLAGQRHEPYVGIHGSGSNGAILHYTKNNKTLEDGELYLIDAGAEFHGYVADITRTWPVSGKFSAEQRDLYQLTLNMQLASLQMVKAGVQWEDVHLAACYTLIDGLRNLGYIKGGTDELLEKNVFALFFPHGIGHFLGLDTHDVGGYPKGVQRIDRPGLKYLRVRRKLEPNMVVTVEPGIYFIKALLEPAFADAALRLYLNEEKLRPLLSFGGIRIEDNLIVTPHGYENMTQVPKAVAEIEAFMNL
jgi:Xaa-Pro dipeptidase